MDVAQLAQMVNWLDEEHRRDRAEISRLQQRIESQSADIIEQARRIQELEGRLAQTQSQLVRFNQVEQSINSTKNELTALVERDADQRANLQREIERARLADREVISRELSEVRRELPRLARLEEAIEVRTVEDIRLSELIMGLRNQVGGLVKETEERTRQIPFLSEQRTNDTKRIAQLQQETVELFKRSEALAGRLPLLEETIRKGLAEADKTSKVVDQVREQMTAFTDKIRSTLVDREQLIARWQETMNEQKGMVQQAYERMQGYAQQIEISRRAVNEMQDFKEMLLREQSQVQELQRLAEERIRREMDEFREDFEKKRRKSELRLEHLWSEQEKYNREVADRFLPLLHDLKVHELLLQMVWKLQESYSNYFLSNAQQWLEGLQKTLRERDDKLRNMEEDWTRQRRNAELFANQQQARRTPGIVSGEPPAAYGPNGKP